MISGAKVLLGTGFNSLGHVIDTEKNYIIDQFPSQIVFKLDYE